MAAPAKPGGTAAHWSRYSALSESERLSAQKSCRELTEEIYEGLDLGAEIRTVAARALGDTVLQWENGGRLAGFAICHWGPASEAGEGCCFVKFGAARPGPTAEGRFARLLDACGALARSVGMPRLVAAAHKAPRVAYTHIVARLLPTPLPP